MRLIDADVVPIIGISDYSVMLQKTLDAQPTVDLWHYPSKGEYPKEKNKQYLCKVKDYREVWYEVVDWDDFWLLNEFNQVVAWQYIIPPKEEV